MKTRELAGVAAVSLTLLCAAGARAGFSSMEVFLPAVGRLAGQGGAQFYTTVWASNLTGASQTFTFQFLRQGQANPSPASFQDTLAAGQTKVYENVIESKLGLSGVIGAARITSTGEIFVSERIFDQAPGSGLGDTVGLFFAGVPKGFSISAGQSASIQGLNQGGAEDFRYNFALIETGGAPASVNVQVFDGAGVLLGQKSYPLLPYEQLQPTVADVVPGFASVNARLTATVASGSGSVLLAGAQLANGSQDSSGFEMSFRDSLIAGAGSAGVTSLNGLTGALALQAGANVTISPSGSNIIISASGGGGGGLTLPLVANLSTPNPLMELHNANGADGAGIDVILGKASGIFANPASAALQGDTDSGYGVVGITTANTFVSGVGGFSGADKATGVYGSNSGGGVGVQGQSVNGVGMYAYSATNDGLYGQGHAGGIAAGVHGITDSIGVGVYGESHGASAWGVFGINDNSASTAYAGYFAGKVYVSGTLEKPGGSFKIDHPLDPENTYLSHSFVESPDMKNIYDGVATLDADGSADVELPAWFEALNRDFRYQLTAIGASQPGLFVSRKVAGNRFRIGGGAPGGEVSWQVTGIRHDPWADAHRIAVEEPKEPGLRGRLLHPELYGLPPERGIGTRSPEPAKD